MGALLFVGAGCGSVTAAAIAAVLTTAVVYTSVALGIKQWRSIFVKVDDLSADIAESLVNIEAIEEEDVETVREAYETSIINSMSKIVLWIGLIVLSGIIILL